MPRKKHLKRLVRERMTKTGEAYVTALAQVQRQTPGWPCRFWRAPPTAEERQLERVITDLCRRLGCSVVPDPAVPGEWARPAFLIRPSSGTPFYLDVGVAPSDPTAAPPAHKIIIAALQSLDISAPATQPQGFPRPTLPLAVGVARAADELVAPDLPHVVAIGVPSLANADAGVTELWTGCGGPRLQISAVLVVETTSTGPTEARLYHHPEPRRPLTATPLTRLPQAVWTRGRYVHGDGESLASLLGR